MNIIQKKEAHDRINDTYRVKFRIDNADYEIPWIYARTEIEDLSCLTPENIAYFYFTQPNKAPVPRDFSSHPDLIWLKHTQHILAHEPNVTEYIIFIKFIKMFPRDESFFSRLKSAEGSNCRIKDQLISENVRELVCGSINRNSQSGTYLYNNGDIQIWMRCLPSFHIKKVSLCYAKFYYPKQGIQAVARFPSWNPSDSALIAREAMTLLQGWKKPE